MNALIAKERYHFHERLFETNTLTLTKAGVASNADTSSRGSKAIAKRVVDILVEEQQHKINMVEKISGQTLGKQFEMLTMEFLQATFPNLQNLYPGKWSILQLGNNNKLKTSDFEQYEHLAYLSALTAENAQLAAALGNDYLVAPDVVVYRELFEDDEINQNQCIVDNDVSKMADIRKVNGGKPLLHASVSAKYTMRSDRAQNSRTEALNLIRNRKGHLPHIVVVTAEPMPNRLASLALGKYAGNKRKLKRDIKKKQKKNLIDESIIQESYAKQYLKMVCNCIYKKEKAYKSFHILSEYLENKGVTGIIYPCTRDNTISGKNLVLFRKEDAVPVENSIREIIY